MTEQRKKSEKWRQNQKIPNDDCVWWWNTSNIHQRLFTTRPWFLTKEFSVDPSLLTLSLAPTQRPYCCWPCQIHDLRLFSDDFSSILPIVVVDVGCWCGYNGWSPRIAGPWTQRISHITWSYHWYRHYYNIHIFGCVLLTRWSFSNKMVSHDQMTVKK